MNNIFPPSDPSKRQYPYRKKSREHRKKIGNVGESLACLYLKKKGFKIVKKNYLKKWGEIDVVATKDAVWHFVEVKTVTSSYTYPSYKTEDGHSKASKDRHETESGVTQETNNTFRAEDNLHPWKMKRVVRATETYLMENGLDEVNWQIDAITIILDIKNRKARIKILENVL